MKKTMNWATAMAGVCVLFLVGCGGGDDDGGSDATSVSVINVAGYWRGIFNVVDGPQNCGSSLTLTQTGNVIGGFIESGIGRITVGRIDGNNVYIMAAWPNGTTVEYALVINGENLSGTSKQIFPNGVTWIGHDSYWRIKSAAGEELQTRNDLAEHGVTPR